MKKLPLEKLKKSKKKSKEVTNIPLHMPFCHKAEGVCYLKTTHDEKVCVGCTLFY